MARADYSIANQSGANFRSELNDTLAAIQSVNSGSGTPTDTVAFQLFVDTNDSNNLKARNAANNGNVTLGPITTTNFGLAPLSGATFTGDVVLNTTTALRLPVGTTAQRSGSAGNGDIRYNSTTSSFEGYAGGAAATERLLIAVATLALERRAPTATLARICMFTAVTQQPNLGLLIQPRAQALMGE